MARDGRSPTDPSDRYWCATESRRLITEVRRTGSLRAAAGFPGFEWQLEFMGKPRKKGFRGNDPSDPVAKIKILGLKTGPLILFTGQIQQQVVDELEPALWSLSEIMQAQESPGPILLSIDSPGGDVGAGLQIFDLIINMNRGPTPVDTEARGTAASMAALWLLAGRWRSGREHCKVLLHMPAVFPGGQSRNPVELHTLRHNLVRVERELNRVIAARTGQPVDEVKELLRRGDRWFNAAEAQKFGIIHAVTGAGLDNNREVTAPAVATPGKVLPLRPEAPGPAPQPATAGTAAGSSARPGATAVASGWALGA